MKNYAFSIIGAIIAASTIAANPELILIAIFMVAYCGYVFSEQLGNDMKRFASKVKSREVRKTSFRQTVH